MFFGARYRREVEFDHAEQINEEGEGRLSK